MGHVRGVVGHVRGSVLRAGPDGGFILGSGCEVPITAKVENVAALIAAARPQTAIRVGQQQGAGK